MIRGGLPSLLRVRQRFGQPLPERFDDDLRLSEALVEQVVAALTRPGAAVFDPFAGFATVPLVAERMGRAGWGVERDADRIAHARTLPLRPERLIHADIRAVDLAAIPSPDLCLSSPVFMHRADRLDPLTGFAGTGSYPAYVAELAAIFARVAARMGPAGWVAVEAPTLVREGAVTPLAWDLAAALGQHLRFAGEVVLDWDRYGHGSAHSYLLLFRP